MKIAFEIDIIQNQLKVERKTLSFHITSVSQVFMMFNYSYLNKILDKSLEIVWLLTIGLMPIYFNPFTYSLWEISGAILFYFLTEILLIIWLAKIILTLKHFNILAWQKYFFKIKYILPAFIFIFLMGLSTFFSESPYLSFFGLYKRQMGYLIWLHYFIFFLILVFNLKSKNQIKHLSGVVTFSSFFVCLYGFCQIFGYDPIIWYELPLLTKRIFSTLGQPNFLASWILLALPLVIYGFLNFRKKISRYFAFLIIVFLLISLILTQSRAGWLGFIFGSIFFLLIGLRKKQIFFYSGLGLIIFLIISFIYFNFHPLAYTGNPFIDRLISITHFQESGGLRLFWWQAALKEIKFLPIFGHGPETQIFHFVKYYQPEWAIYGGMNIYPDRIHNDFLDTLLTLGWPGLMSYLFLIAYTFYLGIKKIGHQISRLFLLAGLLAYLISIQFCFHTIVVGIYFWLYLALINAMPIYEWQANEANYKK